LSPIEGEQGIKEIHEKENKSGQIMERT